MSARKKRNPSPIVTQMRVRETERANLFWAHSKRERERGNNERVWELNVCEWERERGGLWTSYTTNKDVVSRVKYSDLSPLSVGRPESERLNICTSISPVSWDWRSKYNFCSPKKKFEPQASWVISQRSEHCAPGTFSGTKKIFWTCLII